MGSQDNNEKTDAICFHKLVNGEMVCPDVLQLLHFKTSSSTRSNDLFIRQHYGTNYAANSTVARLQRASNNLPSTIDLFHDGVRTLKWKVKGAVLPT
ncbi:hypothetical protein J6590_099250 [Homalodisca vitripennis]|nr:hypothetical protein J6590_099250 [Homalodisca vitripennis]